MKHGEPPATVAIKSTTATSCIAATSIVNTSTQATVLPITGTLPCAVAPQANELQHEGDIYGNTPPENWPIFVIDAHGKEWFQATTNNPHVNDAIPFQQWSV